MRIVCVCACSNSPVVVSLVIWFDARPVPLQILIGQLLQSLQQHQTQTTNNKSSVNWLIHSAIQTLSVNPVLGERKHSAAEGPYVCSHDPRH